MTFTYVQLFRFKVKFRTRGMAQVVECLPDKCETLISTPSKNKERKRKLKFRVKFKVQV
jgi:hypothetical protein